MAYLCRSWSKSIQTVTVKLTAQKVPWWWTDPLWSRHFVLWYTVFSAFSIAGSTCHTRANIKLVQHMWLELVLLVLMALHCWEKRRNCFMLQWAKSTPGNKGQLVHNIKYLDIPLWKSHVNTNAYVYSVLCCDKVINVQTLTGAHNWKTCMKRRGLLALSMTWQHCNLPSTVVIFYWHQFLYK